MQEQKLIAPVGTPAPSEFAFAVAVDGNVAMVTAVIDDGAMSRTGTAYVYAFNGSSWTEQAKLMAANGVTDDHPGLTFNALPAAGLLHGAGDIARVIISTQCENTGSTS